MTLNKVVTSLLSLNLVYLHLPDNVHNGQDENKIRNPESDISIRQQLEFAGLNLEKQKY